MAGIPALAWFVKVVALALGGLLLGALIAQVVALVQKLLNRSAKKVAH